MDSTYLMTVEEFEAMALADRVNTWELVGGAIRKVFGRGFEQSAMGVSIGSEILGYARPRGLGRVTGARGMYILSREKRIVYCPAVAFVVTDRLPVADREVGFFEGSPDLAVEIVALWKPPSALADKARQWLRFGTRLVWVVDPTRRTIAVWEPDAEVRVLTEQDEIDGGTVLPGFRIEVADLLS